MSLLSFLFALKKCLNFLSHFEDTYTAICYTSSPPEQGKIHAAFVTLWSVLWRIQIHWFWIRIQNFGLIWIRIQGYVINFEYKSVFWIYIRTDPHNEMPTGSGSAWTDGKEVKKPRKCIGSLGEYRTGRIKVRILLWYLELYLVYYF